MSVQPSLAVERIKQYPGPVQVLRKVTVQVPGKHFTGLTSVEAGNFYEAQAVEYAERHTFAEEAECAGPVLLQRIVKLHYNWK